MKIPLSAPDVREEEIEMVAAVLRTPQLSLGPKLEEFEQAIAGYIGVENAIGVSSGTAGLHLCVRALGIGAGDEVIVPCFAFIAVANVLRYENAIPLFVDIEAETLNLDASRIEAAITPRTKAILVVHTFGCPVELAKILEIARRHHLYVIEDACEAIGGEYEGRKLGSLGMQVCLVSTRTNRLRLGKAEWLSRGARGWRWQLAHCEIKGVATWKIGTSIAKLAITTGYPK
jgi:perosamine synthetase